MSCRASEDLYLEYDMTVDAEPGKPMRTNGKWTSTFRMQADRTWLCTSDMWNTNRPM